MNSFIKIPFYNKLLIFIFIFTIGASYISYNMYNKLEKVDYSSFDIYKEEYMQKETKIKELKKRLHFLLNLEKKFSNKFINKNDVKLFLINLLDIFKQMQLIDSYNIIDVYYDNKYINMVHVRLQFYNSIDARITKNILQYMFDEIMGHDSVIKLKNIDIDKTNNTILNLTIYK